MQGIWPGERDWGRGRGWKWGSAGCSRETGACTPPLPAPVPAPGPAPIPTAQRLATEHSPGGPESTSSRCRRPAPWWLALGKSLASLCPSFPVQGCRGGGRAAMSQTARSADPELLLRRISCSLRTSKSLIGPQGIYQLWKCWLQLTMLEHQPRRVSDNQRGHLPLEVGSCLWGQILVLES